MFGLLTGQQVLVVGIEDDPTPGDDGEPLLRVFIVHRSKGIYVLTSEVEKVRREWQASSMGHLFMPTPPREHIFQLVNLRKGVRP